MMSAVDRSLLSTSKMEAEPPVFPFPWRVYRYFNLYTLDGGQMSRGR